MTTTYWHLIHLLFTSYSHLIDFLFTSHRTLIRLLTTHSLLIGVSKPQKKVSLSSCTIVFRIDVTANQTATDLMIVLGLVGGLTQFLRQHTLFENLGSGGVLKLNSFGLPEPTAMCKQTLK